MFQFHHLLFFTTAVNSHDPLNNLRLSEEVVMPAATHRQRLIHVAPPTVPLGGDYWQEGYWVDVSDRQDGIAPLWGVADMHAHLMAHLGFGGGLFWGHPDGQTSQALKGCTPAHGRWGMSRASLVEGGIHRDGGYPHFDGWPCFTSRIHQQMYVEWVRRAYHGGLRLMVALAVNNELLARLTGAPRPFDDVTAVEVQIDATKALVGCHQDFMEVAYSPADARRIIGGNRLAVVLGVEVDCWGNWRREGEATDDEVALYLRELHRTGVRHFFPVHLTNNLVGGTAVYHDMFNALNRHLRGDYIQVRDAGESEVQFRLGEDEGLVAILRVGGYYSPPDYSSVKGGHVNALGLTDQGRDFVIPELMRLGMIIDVDHMSRQAVGETLSIAERHGYPVVAGHAAFRDLAHVRGETADVRKLPNEYQRTREEVARIRRLGGMIALGLNQGDVRQWWPGLANDSAGSAKSWAQAYLYAVEQMGGKGVAIGTDMNGLAGAPGPRFGPYGAPALRGDGVRGQHRRTCVDAQINGVRYLEPTWGARAGRLMRGDAYTPQEREVWEAVMLGRGCCDIDRAEVSGHQGLHRFHPGLVGAAGRIRNIAKGIRASRLEELPADGLSGWLFGGDSARLQRGAHYAKSDMDPADISDAGVRKVFKSVRPIWLKVLDMQGDNVPLSKCMVGWSEFDINVDGVAHYGLLPDFLQDLRNVGLLCRDLAPLFRSAEDYVAVWEKCERRKS